MTYFEYDSVSVSITEDKITFKSYKQNKINSQNVFMSLGKLALKIKTVIVRVIPLHKQSVSRFLCYETYFATPAGSPNLSNDLAAEDFHAQES